MKFFDTHCHIALIHEDPIEQLIVIQEATQANVAKIVSICNNINDFNEIYNNLATATNVYYGVGVSPTEVKNVPSDWEYKLESALKLPRVVAIGETGLDYHRDKSTKTQQVELFIRHLELAQKFNMPAIIHNREAGEDVLDILKSKIPSKGVVFHCYSEDSSYAREALSLNCYFSFAGNLTFQKAKKLHETIELLPLSRILVESEAPFMTPARYLNKRNKPAYIGETVHYIARIKNQDVEEIASTLYSNSLSFFNINEI